MTLFQNDQLSTESGFTLIEIIIVVAIMGILAALASLNYQTQVMQTQVMTIYQELNNFRVPYQTLINEGAGVTDFSPSGLNMTAETKYCQFTVTAPAVNGITTNAVTCTIQNLPYVQGKSIRLDRAADGSWQCGASTGISKKYLPQACQ